MRSWYDYHLSEMLNSFASLSYPKNWDFDINLEPYFSTSVYSGYGDTGKCFFRVYPDIFQTLFEHEIAYAHSMGTGPVHEATLKDFSLVDKYRDWRSWIASPGGSWRRKTRN